MRNKILSIFLLLLGFTIILTFRENLFDFFDVKREQMQIKIFNLLLNEKAKNNKIAKPDLFLDNKGDIQCIPITKILNKYQINRESVDLTPILVSSNLVGVKISTQLKISAQQQDFDIFLYFCNPIFTRGMPENDITNILKTMIKKNVKVDGIEVISDKYYEIFGKFWWLIGGIQSGKILKIQINSLGSYKCTSVVTGKTFILDMKEFKSVKPSFLNKVEYKILDFFSELFFVLDIFLLKLRI